MFFYLYAVIDLFSRKLVAWEVHAREGGDEAAALTEGAYSQIEAGDAGHYTIAQRPGVSDDNAHIEAWFRTCKYSPGYPPKGFEDLEHARRWVLKFVTWYNGVHLHSGLGYVTPEQRHSGLANAIFLKRQTIYAAARECNPLRWKRSPRIWQVTTEVWLNPPSKFDQRFAA